MKILKKIFTVFLALTVICAAGIILINNHVISSAAERICENDEAAEIEADCIIVLGAGVYADNNPSPMLKDRLDTAIKIYREGKIKKIIMSGDHGTKYYDEVNTMKKYAEERGVLSEDIFMDHAGFSTYETMYRAKEIFDVSSALVITQKYHLYRGVYDGMQLGIDIYGTATPHRIYGGEIYYNSREVLARIKDFFVCIIKPEAKIMGDKIPVFGNGNITNDKL